MGQILSLPFKLLSTTRTYIFGFFHYWRGAGRHQPFATAPAASTFAPLQPASSDTDEELLFKQQARIHLFTLTANLYLYNKPHYRKGLYATDLVDNLCNVAIPGTGVPLSWIARSRIIAIPFLLVGYPLVSFVAALHHCVLRRTSGTTSLSREYARRLLAPDDWFSYWRLNSVVTGLHALLHDMPSDYRMENKWTFLREGTARGVPVSPYLSTPALVVKHKNEEGGLGIYFYKNATDGGDWILQERLSNAPWVASLLPPAAPLSTFRVITCSRASMAMETSTKANSVTALSCVFRAGRDGAATDHDSILFDVDVTTGRIQGGTTNAHWYRLGLWRGVCTTPWRSEHSVTHHPDGHIPVTGQTVPNLSSMLDLACDAHATLCPRVPFCGWDVVLCRHSTVPICLLEVNLSCNFFRGSFDKKVYLDFVEDLLVELQDLRLQADETKKKFVVAPVL